MTENTNLSKEQILKSFKERILAIGPDTKVAILHDTDADGISSGVICAKAIDRIRGKPINATVYQHHKFVGITPETLERLKKLKIGVLITLDKPIDEEPEQVKEASLYMDIIALDHHPRISAIDDEHILIVKSQEISDYDGAKYPTSKLAFDLFSTLTDLSDIDWVAAGGVIADSCYPTWKEFVDSVSKKYGYTIEKNVFDSSLGKVARYVGSAVIFNSRKVKESYETLYDSRNPDDLLNSQLKDYEDEIEKEIQYWISEHKKKAQFFPELELVFYIVSPRFPINSPLSTILSQKYYPTQTLVVVHDSGDEILSISMRRQDYKVNCPSLIRASLEGLPDASGGGHIPAVGGRVRKSDLPTFLANLKREINSGKHKIHNQN